MVSSVIPRNNSFNADRDDSFEPGRIVDVSVQVNRLRKECTAKASQLRPRKIDQSLLTAARTATIVGYLGVLFSCTMLFNPFTLVKGLSLLLPSIGLILLAKAASQKINSRAKDRKAYTEAAKKITPALINFANQNQIRLSPDNILRVVAAQQLLNSR